MITYDWSLSKTVSPDALTLPKGAAGTVSYTIAATRMKAGESEVAGVRGAICVTNTGAVTTIDLAIADVVEVQTGGGPFTPCVTVPVDVSAKPALGPGESHVRGLCVHGNVGEVLQGALRDQEVGPRSLLPEETAGRPWGAVDLLRGSGDAHPA